MSLSLRERIRRRDTPLTAGLYRLVRALRRLRMPAWRPLYVPLRRERELRLAAWGRLTRLFYWEPMFRTRCAACGPGLELIGGMPQVYGDLRLEIGHDVTLHGRATFAAGKIASRPTLRVGDHSHLGYQLDIAVGARVDIGSRVMIASRVALLGYDFHPLDPVRRANHEPPESGGAERITIGDDVWIGMNCIVLKGVTIGEGAVIGAGSLVTRDVPAWSLAAGQPARVLRSLDQYRPAGRDGSAP